MTTHRDELLCDGQNALDHGRARHLHAHAAALKQQIRLKYTHRHFTVMRAASNARQPSVTQLEEIRRETWNVLKRFPLSSMDRPMLVLATIAATAHAVCAPVH